MTEVRPGPVRPSMVGEARPGRARRPRRPTGRAETLWNPSDVALTCPRTLVRFAEAEGAADHTEAWNRSRFSRRDFDWLDDALA